MSSSKVFREDPAFTPISLVREEITFGTDEQIIRDLDQEEPAAQPEETIPPEPAAPSEQTTASPESPSVANINIETIRKEAYAQGRQEALAEIEQERQYLLTNLQKGATALRDACLEVDRLRSQLFEQGREDIINLVISMARKIIGREINTDRQAIARSVQSAFDLAMKNDEYDIWLHPDDLIVVEEMIPELISSVQQLKHITLKTDPEITPGGCRLDSDICTVDATIEAQLDTGGAFLAENLPDSVITPAPAADTTEGNEGQ
jgi:flagellar assembly protein FliH